MKRNLLLNSIQNLIKRNLLFSNSKLISELLISELLYSKDGKKEEKKSLSAEDSGVDANDVGGADAAVAASNADTDGLGYVRATECTDDLRGLKQLHDEKLTAMCHYSKSALTAVELVEGSCSVRR